MRVLLLGSGARTHALARRILDSGGEVWCIPMVELWQPDPRIHAGPIHADPGEVAKWAADAGIHLAVGVDETAAYADAAAYFEAQNIVYFAPSRAAAALERSKLHSRRVLEALGFELPELLRVVTDPADAEPPGPFPVVLRLDRSPSARGVRVARDPREYAESLSSLACVHAAGGAGPFTVLVEEFASGFEVTFAIFAGRNGIIELPPVRDYKYLAEADHGPLTSGMGGYSPVPSLSAGWAAFSRELFTRVLDYLLRRGITYVGYLNANVIYAGGRWIVLEFNCHMGDPDMGILLPQIDGNIALIMHDLASGSGSPGEIVRPRPSVGISLVRNGYPISAARPGEALSQPDSHAGSLYLFTARRMRHCLFPTGGRVLLACATSQFFRQAVQQAYSTAVAAHVANPTLVYRRDLGLEAME